MTNLNIQLVNIPENVSPLVIDKLYQLALLNEDEGVPTMVLSGSITPSAAYEDAVIYLREKFPNLTINISNGNCYIRFADNNVKTILLNNSIGDGIGVSVSDASTANLGTMFKNNTSITSFNEFKYFTRANTNPSNSMFEGCSNLSQVDLSETLSVSNYEFKDTSITSINAPNLLSSGLNSFSGNHSLTTIVSLGHLSNITNSMFHFCNNIQTVNLPNECVEILYRGFCSGSTTDGILQTINGINHVKNFGGECFYRQKQLQLSANDLQSAVTIDFRAFWYVPVSSINCPNLTSLGTSAFRENKVLTNIECLGKINSIPETCFMQDTALQTVKLPYECTELKTLAFLGDTLLSSVTLYNKSLTDYAEGETPTFTNLSRITNFGNNCFYNCKLLSLTVSDLSSAVSIGSSAFYGCSAISINMLNLSNVTTIGDHAFWAGPHIDNVIWSSSQTTLPTGVFGSAMLKSIINIEHVTKIYGRTLLGCQLNHVLYLKNVDTTYYYGTNINAGDNGNTFTADNKNGSAYALYMPKTKDVYGGYWSNNTYSSGFFGGRGTTTIPVVYFKDLEEIYPSSFGSLTCTSLIINNTTPPTWYNSLKKTDEEVADNSLAKDKAFPGDCHITYIFVPDSALTTYTSDADWSTLIAKGVTFKSMNELTHYLTEADWIAAGKPTDGIIDAYMSY